MRRDAAAAPTAVVASPSINTSGTSGKGTDGAVVINVDGAPPAASADPGVACRICHLSPDPESGDGSAAPGSMVIRLGCGCKGELGVAHRHCAEAWFRIKGDRLSAAKKGVNLGAFCRYFHRQEGHQELTYIRNISPQAKPHRLRQLVSGFQEDGGTSAQVLRFRWRQVQVSPGRRRREEHRLAARRAAVVRRREQALRVRADTGVARGLAGGDGAERDQDVGDGAVAQGPDRGLQVGEPRAVPAVRQRRAAADGGGGAGRGQLQRAARRPSPAGRRRVRRRRRDLRVLARRVPRRLPARLRLGGAPRVLRPAAHRVQVSPLGPHGGPLQGPLPHRQQGRVPRRRRPQGGRAAAGGGRGGVLRSRRAAGGAHQGPHGGAVVQGGGQRGRGARRGKRGRSNARRTAAPVRRPRWPLDFDPTASVRS